MLRYFVSIQNTLARTLQRDDRGATAVEYGLMEAGALGTETNDVFNKVANAI